MILERATDAEFINFVANDPAVRPHLLGGTKAIDYSPLVKDHNNVVLQAEHGGMVFHKLMSGFFEVHSQRLPSGSPAWTLEMAHSALLYMFTKTDCVEIMTRVPVANEPARKLTLAMGGVLEQTVGGEVGGEPIMWGIYRLTCQDWIRTSPLLEARGEWFHARLHGLYDEHDMAVEKHDSDPWHDRHVGMAVSMILGGQVDKGVGFYRRWCMMALAPPISVVSRDPLVIDINDCLLHVHDGTFDIVEK